MVDAGDFPVGFIGFFCDIQYSEACSFCADSNFDVLELFISGINFLVFYKEADYMSCVFFCLYENFDILKYHVNQ